MHSRILRQVRRAEKSRVPFRLLCSVCLRVRNVLQLDSRIWDLPSVEHLLTIDYLWATPSRSRSSSINLDRLPP
jgi:hypothetical protein